MRSTERIFAVLGAAAFAVCSLPARAQSPVQAQRALLVRPSTTYTNPLSLFDPKTGPALSCPDPAIINQNHDRFIVWYLYCTGDPLNSRDKDANGNLKNHLISSYSSVDLIHWIYIGDVLQSLPGRLWFPQACHLSEHLARDLQQRCKAVRGSRRLFQVAY